MQKKEFLKNLKIWKFYRLCEEDLFGKFLIKHYVNQKFSSFRMSKKIKYYLKCYGRTDLKIIHFLRKKRLYRSVSRVWKKTALFLKYAYKPKPRKKFKLKKKFKINLSYLWLLSIVEKFKKTKTKKLSQVYAIYGKKFRRYYNNISIKEIKKLGLKSSIDFINCFQTFIFKLETRLDLIIYRLHLFSNLKNCKSFIKGDNLYINNKLVNKNTLVLKNNKILSISLDLRSWLLYKVLYKLRNKILFYNYPCYFEVNWRTLMCVIVKPAKLFKQSMIPFYNKLYPNLVYNSYLL